MKYARLSGAEARLLLVLRDAPPNMLVTWYMAQSNIGTSQTYYRARKRLLEEGLVTMLEETPTSSLSPSAPSGPLLLPAGEVSLETSPKDNNQSININNIYTLGSVPQNTNNLIHNEEIGVPQNTSSSTIEQVSVLQNTKSSTTGVPQNTNKPNHSEGSVLQNTNKPNNNDLVGVLQNTSVPQNTTTSSIPAVGPSQRQKVAAVLRAWNEGFPKVPLTAQTASQFLGLVGGDHEIVVEEIVSAAANPRVNKPIGWILAVLKKYTTPVSSSPVSPARSVEQQYAVGDTEKRVPTDEEIAQLRKERENARKRLEAALSYADE